MHVGGGYLHKEYDIPAEENVGDGLHQPAEVPHELHSQDVIRRDAGADEERTVPECTQGECQDKRNQYSVLMSVYHKDNPEYLDVAIQSMVDQTVRTNDFVIVCDGVISQEIEHVLGKYVEKYPEIFHIVRLSKNQGLGNALRVGMSACKNELVARMDSDDVSVPYRCELQLQKFQSDSELALCSADIAEFDNDPHNPISVRHVPEDHEEIIKYAKKRSPMNHVAVMFKKTAVENVGGYIEINCAEDYYLWARMLNAGYKAANIPEVLVNVRVGNGMYSRRGGGQLRKECDIPAEENAGDGLHQPAEVPHELYSQGGISCDAREDEEEAIPDGIEEEFNPLISIVMPVYNSEKYLPDTISSIINQSYENWELLAVDDCSTDNSYGILCSYEQLDSRIKALRLEKNSGPAKARNEGIRYCGGQYLTFIDSDDLWHRDKLMKELKFASDNNYNFVFTAYDLVNESGRATGLVVPVPCKIDYRELLYNNIISTITVMINIGEIGKFTMPNYLGEDLATWLMLIKQTTYAYGLNEVLASYRQVPSSISHDFKSRMSRTWIVYRKSENLPFWKSVYLYIRHMICMLKKRRHKDNI